MHRSFKLSATTILTVVCVVLAIPLEAGQNAKAKRQNIIGSWLFTIDFGPEGPPPFREIITFHRGGTLTETNTTLNANSATDPTARRHP